MVLAPSAGFPHNDNIYRKVFKGEDTQIRMEIKVKSQSKGQGKDVSYYTPTWLSCKETRKRTRIRTMLEQSVELGSRVENPMVENNSCMMHEMHLNGNKLYKKYFRSIRDISGISCDVCQGNRYCKDYKELIKK